MFTRYSQYFVLALVAFGPLLFFPFVYDDVAIIQENDYLGTWSGFLQIWAGHVDSAHVMDGVCRPIFLSFLSLITAIFGPLPWVFRIVSLLLHALSTWLLFLLGKELFRLSPAKAHFVALVFLLLPIHVTHIDLVWKQSDLWIAAFALLSLRFLASNQLWIPAALFVVGLGIKESALILPVIWMLADPLLNRHTRSRRWILVGGAAVIGFLFYYWVWPVFPRPIDTGGTPGGRWLYFTTQLSVFPLYLQAVIWPWILTIDRNLPYAQVPSLLAYISMTALVLSALILWIRAFRKPRAWILAILMALAWMIPTSTLQPLALPYDETRLYLTLAFGLIGLGHLFHAHIIGLQIRPLLLRSFVFAILLGLGFTTFVQTFRFSSETALWNEALRVDPRSARAHYQLGFLAEEERAFDEAEHHYRQALFFSPDFSGAALNLGLILGKKGNLDGARAEFQKLLSQEPYWKAMAHFHLGLAAIYRSAYDQASQEFNQVRAFPPLAPLADRGEALRLTHMNRPNEARAAWSRYLNHPSLSPDQINHARSQMAKLAGENALR